MEKQILAILSQDETNDLVVAMNKESCAGQSVRLDAIPPDVSPAAAENFFREALFSLADAKYLQDCFWRDLRQRFGIKADNVPNLLLDFQTRELLLRN
jgi:hypothetical protein